MSTLRSLAVGVAGLILGSCAPNYVSPLGGPTATILHSIEGLPHAPGGVSLFRATSDECQDLAILAHTPAQMEAGRRTVMMTRAYTSTDGDRCYNVASFTPEAGRTYTVITSVAPRGGGCGISVVDDTQREAPDFVRLPVRGRCVF